MTPAGPAAGSPNDASAGVPTGSSNGGLADAPSGGPDRVSIDSSDAVSDDSSAAAAVAAGGVEPSPRAARAERAVRGAGAAMLVLEALTVLFVPRAIAQFGPGLTAARLALLLGLAAALVVAAALQRHRVGLVAGSVLQGAVIATGLLAGAMYVLGVIFGLVWIYLLRVRRELLRR